MQSWSWVHHGGRGRNQAMRQPLQRTLFRRIQFGMESLEERTLLVAGPMLYNDFAGIQQSDGSPPDPIAAAGPYNILGAVNDDVALFAKETGQQIAQADFYDFFGAVHHNYQIFDPWTVFDPYASRYVVLAAEKENGPGANESYFLIGISTTDNPNDFDTLPGDLDNDWHVYSLSSSYDFGGGPTWSDYPKLAVDADSIYITSNNIPFGNYADGLLVTRLDKTPMLGGVMGSVTRIDGSAAGLLKTTQTVQSTGRLASEPQLFVSPCAPSGEFWPGIRVFELDDSNHFSSGSSCLGSPFKTGHFATQLGSHAQFISAGSQLMNAVWRDDSLWTAHAVSNVAEPYKTVSAIGLPIAIPDQGTITSPITVTSLDGLLVDVDVTLTINHTYDADLDVYLTSPQGTRVELFTDVGGAGDNFVNTFLDDTAVQGGSPSPIANGTAPFSGNYRPEGYLSVLEGEDPNGQWILEVTDDAGGDVGSLVSWSLDFKVGDDTVRWYEIGTTGGYSLIQQGYIDPGPGVHTFFPAIAVDGAGNMGICYTESSYREYPHMMITGRRGSDPPGYTTPGIVVQSSGSSYGLPTQVDAERWGDYGGLAVDPADDATFWAFHEYAINPTTWSTWWGAFTFETASISGYKWQDENGDGVWQSSEPVGVASLFLDGNNNGVIDSHQGSFSALDARTVIFDTKTTTSRIEVANLAGYVLDVNVVLNISHTYDADLDVYLYSPSGTRVELFTDVGGSGHDFFGTTLDDEAATAISSGTAPFTGSYRPEGLLRDFDGENPNGSWTLQITDDAGGDFGMLNAWVVSIEYGDPNLLTFNGAYGFYDLAPGTHVVREQHNPGNLRTEPADSHSVHLLPGDAETNRNFGNAEPVQLSGRKWHDLDGDGILDATEPALAGRRIYVDANANALWDSGLLFVQRSVVNLPIADVSTVSSTIAVADRDGLLLDVDVQIGIAHTSDTDLDVVLISPSGTEVELFSDVGGFGDNFTDTLLDDEAAASIVTGSAPFTGSWRPEQPLSMIDGEDPNGIWRLRITDDQAGDVGTLLYWELRITCGDPSDLTDATGFYEINSIAPGYYPLREVPINGWLQTYPDERFLYASAGVSAGVSRLAAIDRSTGGTWVIGMTGTQGLAGLASEVHGNLLGIGIGGSTSVAVYSLNPINGEAVSYYDVPLSNFSDGGFAIGPDGLGYAVRTLLAQPPELYQIDLAAQQTFYLGQLKYGGLPLPGSAQVDGLSFRGDQLYGLVTDLAGSLNDHLVAIDLGTLALTDVGPLGTNIGLLAGLAYDATQDLFFATGRDNNFLYSVEPGTGSAMLIGPTGLEEVSGLTMAASRGTPLAGGHLVFAKSGSLVTNLNFGNAQPSQIRGTKYDDDNGNGVFEVGEVPVAGRTIFVDKNQNGVFDEAHGDFRNWDRDKPLPDLASSISTLSLANIKGAITDIDLQLRIEHTYVGDLEGTLISPDGSRVTLFNRIGGSGDDFYYTTFDDEAPTSITSGTPPYDGVFRPQGLLSALDGQDPNGIWSLEIVDHAAGDSGQLIFWELRVSYGEPQYLTDAAGHYEFSGLAPGLYDVREIVPTGWVATEPQVDVRLLDSFEDGNVAEYTRAEFGTFAGFANNAAAHDGAWGLVAGDWIYRNDAQATVRQGDVISAWVRFANNASGRFQLGFGASATGTMSFVLSPEYRELLIENNANYSFTPISRVHQNFVADRWYRAEVTWGHGGVMVGRLFDSDGTTLLGSVTAIDNSVIVGGIAVRGAGVGSVRQVDTITIFRNGADAVSIASGQVANDTNFGSAQPGVIGGFKWHDQDGDGSLDGNEPFLPGWTIFVDSNRNGIQEAMIDNIASVDTHHFLPDRSKVVSTIPVYDLLGLTLDVNVTLNISHSYDADLDVFLISPQGHRVELFSGVGFDGDGFVNTTLDDEASVSITMGAAPFTGSFRPEGLLSDFDNLNPNGIWRLEINDTGPGDVGILNSWSISITHGDPSSTTDAGGAYHIVNLAPGSYQVREIQQPGWIQTAPMVGYHDVSLQ